MKKKKRKKMVMMKMQLLGMRQKMVSAIESAIETSNGVGDGPFPWAQRAREAPLPRLQIGHP